MNRKVVKNCGVDLFEHTELFQQHPRQVKNTTINTVPCKTRKWQKFRKPVCNVRDTNPRDVPFKEKNGTQNQSISIVNRVLGLRFAQSRYGSPIRCTLLI